VITKAIAMSIEAGVIAAALFLASPVVTSQIRTFSAPDLAGTALILAAVAVIVSDITTSDQGSWKSMWRATSTT
jgi:hypothetical protein